MLLESAALLLIVLKDDSMTYPSVILLRSRADHEISLLSAGADSSVAIWDLEASSASSDGKVLHTPLAHIPRSVLFLHF